MLKAHLNTCCVRSLRHVDGLNFLAAKQRLRSLQALSAAQQERDAAVQTLADTERRFVQMAKKKQAEHSTKVGAVNVVC